MEVRWCKAFSWMNIVAHAWGNMYLVHFILVWFVNITFSGFLPIERKESLNKFISRFYCSYVCKDQDLAFSISLLSCCSSLLYVYNWISQISLQVLFVLVTGFRGEVLNKFVPHHLHFFMLHSPTTSTGSSPVDLHGYKLAFFSFSS